MTGLALVEMACWDAIGKKVGMPVYKLMGGKVNDKIKHMQTDGIKLIETL